MPGSHTDLPLHQAVLEGCIGDVPSSHGEISYNHASALQSKQPEVFVVQVNHGDGCTGFRQRIVFLCKNAVTMHQIIS
jgi:hypothetical protein